MSGTPGNEVWRRFAACRDEPADLFFLSPGDSPEHGLAVCARCPARKGCLEHALAAGERFGIWGGETPQRRTRIRTARAMAGAA